MILIAESGSTKTDWVLIDESNEKQYFKTIGFNPFFHSTDLIVSTVQKNKELIAYSDQISKVFFYGAGCSSSDMNQIVLKAMNRLFPNADSNVDHDLLACALATYEDEPSISCILGTGSNSCFFDGENVREEVPAIAYVLGDEGSGAYYGKKLLRDYLYNKLPTDIKYGLENELKITKAAIFERVYMRPHANVYLASFIEADKTQSSIDFNKQTLVKLNEELTIKFHLNCNSCLTIACSCKLEDILCISFFKHHHQWHPLPKTINLQ